MRSENKEIAQRIQGKLLVEVGEMAGMAKKDVDELKDFLTLKEDQWRPAYSRDQKVGVRHCLFIMTTNDDQFLTDSTGNRRYAVVNIDDIDIEKVKADLHQLWAEGKHIYETVGVNKLHADVEALQGQYNEENVEEDPWEQAILDWFEAEEFLKPKDRQFHDTRSILKFAIGMTDAQIEKKHTKRLRNVLRRLNFEYKLVRKGLKRYKGWVAPKELKEEFEDSQTVGSAD
jgi:predicted P-loop ATPase